MGSGGSALAMATRPSIPEGQGSEDRDQGSEVFCLRGLSFACPSMVTYSLLVCATAFRLHERLVMKRALTAVFVRCLPSIPLL